MSSSTRYELHADHNFKLDNAIYKIQSMKEQIAYQSREIEKRGLESEIVTTLPLLKSLYEDILYIEEIVAMRIDHDEREVE